MVLDWSSSWIKRSIYRFGAANIFTTLQRHSHIVPCNWGHSREDFNTKTQDKLEAAKWINWMAAACCAHAGLPPLWWGCTLPFGCEVVLLPSSWKVQESRFVMIYVDIIWGVFSLSSSTLYRNCGQWPWAQFLFCWGRWQALFSLVDPWKGALPRFYCNCCAKRCGKRSQVGNGDLSTEVFEWRPAGHSVFFLMTGLDQERGKKYISVRRSNQKGFEVFWSDSKKALKTFLENQLQVWIVTDRG